MLKRLKELLSDSLTYGASNMLGQLIGFLLLPLYTRYLTPADYGLVALLAILGVFFIPLGNLGMTNAIFRHFNLVKDDSQRREVLTTGLASVTVVSILLMLGGIVVSSPLSKTLLDETRYGDLVIISLITAAINGIGEVPAVVLRAERRVKTAAALEVFSVLEFILLTIFMVVVLHEGVRGVIWANLLGGIIATIADFYFTLHSFSPAFNYQTWRKMLSYGLPFLPHRLLSFGMAQFGLYMVSHMLGVDQAGLYSLATRVTMPIIFVIGSVQRAWVPYKFQIHASEEAPAEIFRSITTYYVAVIFYLWVGVSLWGPEVVRVMTASSFHAAAPLVPFIGLISVMQGVYFMLGTGIELSDNTRPMPLISLSGLVTVVAAAFLTIPVLDAYGAALATTFGWIAMTLAIYTVSQKRFVIHYDWLALAALVLTAGGIVVVGILANSASLLIRLVLASGLSLAYPVLVFLVLYRSPTERERIQVLRLKAEQIVGAVFHKYVQEV